MTKYKGYILDDQGFIVFEFTTRFCRGEAEATQQAHAILDAWKLAHPEEKFFYTMDRES